MKDWRSWLGGFVLLCAMVTPVFAEVGVRPMLIEETVQPRDSITRDITLSNPTDRKLIVFATVNEISLGAEGEIKSFVSPVMTDRTNTVTSWIEITRGRIELEAGETKQVPLKLQIHPYAEEGEYYAFIGFVATSKRAAAEAVALNGEADGVILNIEVSSTDVESFSVNTIDTSRVMLNPSAQTVLVGISNDGDLPISPNGEVIFYNSRGVEIGAVPLNEAKTTIESGSQTVFELPINIPSDFGRFRASVNVAHENVSIKDGTEFYVLPWPVLIGLLVILLGISGSLTFLIRRSLVDHDSEYFDGHEITLFDNTGATTAQEADHDISLKS